MKKIIKEIRENGSLIAIHKWRKNNPEKKLDFSGMDLSGLNFESAELQNTNFSGANLRNICFNNTNLLNADLSNTDCTNASFIGAELMNVNAKYAIFENTDFSNSNPMNMYNKAYAIWARAKFNNKYQANQILVFIMSSWLANNPLLKIFVSYNHFEKEGSRYDPEKQKSFLTKLKSIFRR
ncbi:MAG: pentapeptide repeat-containing protein [Candidatus Magasanikbacteria bacterium]|nr:pentapeptide repeat-containing protein [Candidatus Magasanikbacteria bacterium]